LYRRVIILDVVARLDNLVLERDALHAVGIVTLAVMRTSWPVNIQT
jgi:hypothetical protein